MVFKGEDRIAAKMDPRVREDDDSGGGVILAFATVTILGVSSSRSRR
jgi:hypothetical protein